MAGDAAPALTLYSRQGCHLCDEMLEQLRREQQRLEFAIVVVDIDRDPGLRQRYGEDVPVLTHEGREVCRHRLDVTALVDLLAGQR